MWASELTASAGEGRSLAGEGEAGQERGMEPEA